LGRSERKEEENVEFYFKIKISRPLHPTGLAGAALTTGIAAQQRASQPDFSSNQVGWIPIGGDFIEVPGEGPPLVRNDARHPYVVNGAGPSPRTGSPISPIQT